MTLKVVKLIDSKTLKILLSVGTIINMGFSFYFSVDIDSFVHTSVFYLLNSIVALNDKSYQEKEEVKKVLKPFILIEIGIVALLTLYLRQMLEFAYLYENISVFMSSLKFLILGISLISFCLQAFAQSNTQTQEEVKASFVAQNLIRDEFKNHTLPSFDERKKYYENEKRKFLTQDRKKRGKKK